MWRYDKCYIIIIIIIVIINSFIISGKLSVSIEDLLFDKIIIDDSGDLFTAMNLDIWPSIC